MSLPSVMSWDVQSVVQQYMDTKNRQRSLPSELRGFDLSNLKVQVHKNLVWSSDPLSPYKGPVSKATVTRHQSNLQVFGNVSTTGKDEVFSRVFIQSGRLKGLNKELMLPVDPLVPLGHVVIDLSKESSERTDTFNVQFSSGKEIPPDVDSATANVYRNIQEYEGNFKCEVALEGKVIFRMDNGISISSQSIAEIVSETRPSYLTVDGKYVSWIVQGRCEFRWNTQQTIEWQ